MVGALDQVVDASLAQQVGLGLFRGSSLTIGRAFVHPINSVDALLPSSSLELALQFLFLALLFDLIQALLRALALGKGFLLLIVDSGLVAPQSWMEGLLEVEIAASHDECVLLAAL